MFNRGEGRLYQSVQPVYSNSQSVGAYATTRGDVITAPNKDNTGNIDTYYGPVNSSEQFQPTD